jgi:sugar (pentulose or hexulose) kinase
VIRAIAVVDAGKTTTKVNLFDSSGAFLAARKVAAVTSEGPPYRAIDTKPLIAFCREALAELDAIQPVDVVVPSAHGAALALLAEDGSLAMPVMDYTSEPPPDIVEKYNRVAPSFEETFSPTLPLALTHGLQLYWQQQRWPEAFARTTTVVPWIQYITFLLSGKRVTEIAGMSCQSHLMDVRTNTLSSLVRSQGWSHLFPPMVKAWDVIGELTPEFKGQNFRGRGAVLAGVHDSSGNYLRYLTAGQKNFTLLSTGTWIIGFNSETRLSSLDPLKDTVSNTDVFGKPVACCRFFGGREFETLSEGSSGNEASLECVEHLVNRSTFAQPSFTEGGGPVPNVGGKGKTIGPPPKTPQERVSLASLYCALMVCESLDAINSKNDVIVDGPFSDNHVFLQLLAQLRGNQNIVSSDLRDGTTAGAACLALMPDGNLPHVPLSLTRSQASKLAGLQAYQTEWKKLAYARRV